MRTLISILLVFALAHVARADLLVSSRLSHKVLRYDDSQQFAGEFATGGNIVTPNGLAIGPDGMLYVCSRDGGQVLRFDGSTGIFDRVFAQGPEMVGPSGLTFGSEGDLYVANSLAANVARYDGSTGALVSMFGLPGTLSAPISVAFGNDAFLYVTSAANNRLVRYDPSSGAEQILLDGGILAGPADIKRGIDGRLYIANPNSNRVTRYDIITGVHSVFGAVQAPVGLAFGPGGDLFVASFNGDAIVRLNGANGQSKGAYIPAGLGGLDGPQYLVFIPEPASALSALAATMWLGARRKSRRRQSEATPRVLR